MLFQLVQIIYWLVLSTWFGGALFIAVAAQVVFQTVRQNNPILPHVLSVNLEGQHSTLLSGTIVANLIGMLSNIEMICAGVMVPAIGAQWFLLDRGTTSVLISLFVRSALLVTATGVIAFDRWVLWPKIWQFRQTFIDNADDPDKANPAREQFDRYQRESFTLLHVLVFLLLGIVLFSGAIAHPTYTYMTSP
jgi:hypothetical protein